MTLLTKNLETLIASAITDRWDEAENADDVDRALIHYSLDADTKHELNDIFDEALARYHNDTALTIYRGLNFDSKESFDAFISSLNDDKTTVKFNEISSWTTNYDTAMGFAVTRPTYIEFMSANDVKYLSSKKDDYITGYRGVILKSKIDVGTAIDLSKLKYSSEAEILVPANTSLSIEVEELIPFNESTKGKDFNDLLLSISKKDLETNKGKKLFNYILNRKKPDELSDEARQHIIDLYPVTFKPCFCKITDDYEDKLATIVTPALFNHRVFNYYPESFQNKVVNYVLPSLDAAVKEAYDLFRLDTDHIVKIEYLMDDTFKEIPAIKKILEKYKYIVKEKYNKMNEKENFQKIKNQNDMDRYTKNILNLLKSI